MELTLLGSVAVVAFVIGGGFVLLYVAFRRTIELRGALIQAMSRIERLERAIASGEPLPVANVADAIPAATPPAANANAPATAETSYTTAAEAALAEDRIEPPPLAVVSLCGGLAAIAALAASFVRWISPHAGVDLALLAGVLVIAAAEWRRSADRASAAANAGLKPDSAALSALIGLTIMTGALVYGWNELRAVPSPVALLGVAVISLVAAGLSTRHGPSMLAFSLLIGAFAPALAPVDHTAPPGRYLFLIALMAVTMALARRRAAPHWAWIAAAIALGWGFNGAAWGGEPATLSAIGAYFTAIAVITLAYAWDDGAATLPFPDLWHARWTEPIATGFLLVLGAASGLTLLALSHPAPPTYAAPGFVATAALAIGASLARPGLWFGPILVAIASALAIGFWPVARGDVLDAPTLLLLAATLAFVFSLGGGLSLLRAKDPKPGAALAALAPIVLLAATFERIGAFGPREYWAVAALAIAALNALAHLQMRRAKPDAAAAFAAGSALALTATLYTLTPAPYAPLTLAAALPLIALADRLRGESGLRGAALGLGVALVARLVGPEIFVVTANPPPLIATLFLPSAAAVLIASFVFARRGRESAATQTSLALALVIAASCATLVARHVFTAGQIGAPYTSLAELGINTLVWSTVALTLAWRFGSQPSAHLYALELLAFGAAAVNALIVGGVFLNPWWGLAPAEVTGWRGFNLIELAFGAPTLLFLLYAQLRFRQAAPTRATIAFALALALFLLALALELRRLFHGAAMAHAPVTMAEAWSYSVAGLGYAAILFGLSKEHGSRALRFTALALALVCFGKIMFSDLTAIDGLYRFVASVGAGALAGGLTWLALRAILPPILPRAPAQPKTVADANLFPPA